MRTVVDWSMIAHICWNRMLASGYEWITEDEITEYTINLVKEALYYATRFDSSETILALDGPTNWRQKVVDDYYFDKCDFHMSTEDQNIWYARVEKSIYKVEFDTFRKKWKLPKKLSVKDSEPLQLGDVVMYTNFINGATPQAILDHDPSLPTHVSGFGAWKGLKEVVPKYKGNRKSWKAKTPRAEFKRLTAELAAKIAPLIGAKEILVDNAEGDDVIASYVMHCNAVAPEEELVLISGDGDLQQLQMVHPNLTIYDPMKKKFKSSTIDETAHALLCKVIGGDNSDNIKGLSFVNRSGLMPNVKYTADGEVSGGKGTLSWIEKITEPLRKERKPSSDVWAAVYAKLGDPKIVDQLSYHRNLTLIYLTNCPAELQHNINELITKSEIEEVEYTWDSFGVTDAQVRAVRAEAMEDRNPTTVA